MKFFGDFAVPYVDLGSDVSARVTSREYAAADLLADGTRLFSQLAKDWARAWTALPETVKEVARGGPGGRAHAAGRVARRRPARGHRSDVDVDRGEGGRRHRRPGGRHRADRSAGVLRSGVDRRRHRTLPAADLAVTVEPLGAGALGVRVQTTNTSAPRGLYVGRLDHRRRAAARPRPPLRLAGHEGLTTVTSLTSSAETRLDRLLERLLTAAETSLAAGDLEPARVTAEEVRAVDPGQPAGRPHPAARGPPPAGPVRRAGADDRCCSPTWSAPRCCPSGWSPSSCATCSPSTGRRPGRR